MDATTDPRRFPFPPGIPLIGLLLGWILGRIWPIPVHWPPWTRWAGWFLFLSPHLLAFWAIRTFRRHQTVAHPRGKATTIVTEGPFRYSRNPMYVSLLLVYVGAMLAFRISWAAVLFVPVFLALRYVVIVPEERYLQAVFGEQYTSYLRQVRRWL
jgi:protein-S-isoprenylcysteine O-methyltransferase Ste14